MERPEGVIQAVSAPERERWIVDNSEPNGEEISLFVLGTALLRNRNRVLRWALAGVVIAALFTFLRPPMYRASASFTPQGGETSRSGLASIASQFGVTLPSANQSTSPEFYAGLLRSRVLLLPIARDTFAVEELGGRRIPVVDLFELRGSSEGSREDKAVALLKRMVIPTVTRATAVVDVSVESKWRSVSLQIVTRLIDGVNDFNQRTRRGQASAERKFVGERLSEATAELRVAENRLESFLSGNRDLGGAPQLSMQRDRLQRDVTWKQQVFSSLMESYQDARIREVRDTPVITVIESPGAATDPVQSRRVLRLLLGLIVGGIIGTVLVLVSATVARRRTEGNEEANEFFSAWTEVKRQAMRPFRLFARRRRPATTS